MKRMDAHFYSKGHRCSAWLYLPDDVKKPPVIVMAHGFAGQKDFGLQPYAEHFAGQGMAVYLFDYRNFGGSEGEPRNLVNPWRHLNDWKAAVSHVRSLDNVDGRRMALWGTSFSGGHVLVTASRDKGIRAVISQVPFVDGIATTMQFPIPYQIEGFFHGMKDLFNKITGKAPHMVPAVALPMPEPAPVMTTTLSLKSLMPGMMPPQLFDRFWLKNSPCFCTTCLNKSPVYTSKCPTGRPMTSAFGIFAPAFSTALAGMSESFFAYMMSTGQVILCTYMTGR